VTLSGKDLAVAGFDFMYGFEIYHASYYFFSGSENAGSSF
jgi:hypothetical protein